MLHITLLGVILNAIFGVYLCERFRLEEEVEEEVVEKHICLTITLQSKTNKFIIIRQRSIKMFHKSVSK